MRRPDLKLLREALASKGGGVNPNLYSEASRLRMMRAGLIQWKPNHCNHHTGYTSLLTITAEGKEELKNHEATK